MRVALYARVSTQRQAQAQSVEQQMGRLTDHAQQQGWEVRPDQIFRDDGIVAHPCAARAWTACVTASLPAALMRS